ncbi:uncharacterized protein LOC124366377 isoform X2 [Homalodisca vitripennis]|uniref:uncharacterized protein LOC124366377 isoform X2 n=1 Tax=Homalodisca vitripennis TaxID=197043 RepID=UPI001EEC9A8A|nr:uncharacterized protein LOC124366377 isoform X2 [Homalodisca vitripennis]
MKMINPEQDPELMSVFTIDDDDDDAEDSDEEYYPISPTGKTLREVEDPYDKTVRIQQANRELFSQPGNRKKQPNKVTFDPVPKMIILNDTGDVTGMVELTGILPQKTDQEERERQQRLKNSYRRRQTPMFLASRHTSQPSTSSTTTLPIAPRLTVKPRRATSPV